MAYAGFQLGADGELVGGAGACGKQLPLHLGREGEPGDPAGPLVGVGVALGDEDLVPQQIGDVRQLVHGLGGGPVAGQPDREDAGPFAADGHRQMVVDGVAVPDLLLARFLAAEGPALGAVVEGERLLLAGRRVVRGEDRGAVVGEEQLYARRAVRGGEHVADPVHERVRRGCPHRSSEYVVALRHGLSDNLDRGTGMNSRAAPEAGSGAGQS